MNFFAENYILFIIAFLSGVIFLLPSFAKYIYQVKELSINDAVSNINKNKAFIIDCRSKEEFKTEFIKNSINIPHNDMKYEFDNKTLKKNKDKIVIIIGSNNSYFGVFNKLKKLGFQNVNVLTGGINAWKENNLPIEPLK